MTVLETLSIFTLRNGRELYIETPDWFFEYSGNITVRTPHSTHVVYNKDGKSNRPLTEDLLLNNYLSKTPCDNATNTIENNQISFKPFGGDEQIYEVTVTETVVDLYCDSYPPLTMVQDK